MKNLSAEFFLLAAIFSGGMMAGYGVCLKVHLNDAGENYQRGRLDGEKNIINVHFATGISSADCRYNESMGPMNGLVCIDGVAYREVPQPPEGKR